MSPKYIPTPALSRVTRKITRDFYVMNGGSDDEGDLTDYENEQPPRQRIRIDDKEDEDGDGISPADLASQANLILPNGVRITPLP
jgi:hypothetical protein